MLCPPIPTHATAHMCAWHQPRTFLVWNAAETDVAIDRLGAIRVEEAVYFGFGSIFASILVPILAVGSGFFALMAVGTFGGPLALFASWGTGGG